MATFVTVSVFATVNDVPVSYQARELVAGDATYVALSVHGLIQQAKGQASKLLEAGAEVHSAYLEVFESGKAVDAKPEKITHLIVGE